MTLPSPATPSQDDAWASIDPQFPINDQESPRHDLRETSMPLLPEEITMVYPVGRIVNLLHAMMDLAVVVVIFAVTLMPKLIMRIVLQHLHLPAMIKG